MLANEIDNYIVLNEEQRKEVCEELARLVFEIRKDNRVECIYFTPLKNFDIIKGNVLEITIVKRESNISEEEKKWDDYNEKHQEEAMVKQFGVKFYVDVDSSERYTLFPQNPSEKNGWYTLLNSTILMDRTTEYTRIQKKAKNSQQFLSYFSNIAQIDPPITDELNWVMEEHRMQEETKVVKEFTKTKTFQYIVNME